MSSVIECAACHRDHLGPDRVPAGWVCDGCRGVPEAFQSCGCSPAPYDGSPTDG